MDNDKYFWETGGGGQNDPRFYKRDLGDSERVEVLTKLLAAFVAVAEELQIAPILMHGALLGWHWNKRLLPWDHDIDMCVTLDDLQRASAFAGVFRRGGETYLWDVSPHFTSRATLNAGPRDLTEPNKIDARFIECASGHYIDVTALAEQTPGTLSTKCPHFYRRDDIFPTRVDTLNGVRVRVPQRVEAALVQEYGEDSIRCPVFGGYAFDQAASVWKKGI